MLGLFSINLGFYIVPVYKLQLNSHIILGLLSIYLAYFIFGLPPITLYFRWLLKDSWKRALLEGSVIVIMNVIVMASFAYIVMRQTGKI
jgi:hypothetical protein